MQLLNKHNWNERSLLYLCRVFSNLSTGDDYSEVKPATHIGFVNFNASPNDPAFYSTYKLLDTKKHRVYSNKLVINVVDLTQINLATEEDKAYQIDRWAMIFKANTWEELRMLTRDNEYMEEVTKSLFNCNLDPQICKQCQDWEFEQRLAKMDENYKKKLRQEIVELTDTKTQLLNATDQLEDNNLLLQEKNTLLNDKNNQLKDKNNQLKDKNNQLKDKNNQLKDKNNQLKNWNAQLQDENARLKAQLAALTQSQQ